ncbi:MAG TPA: hypothetical protein VFG83_11710 [Kofleriaceae bacterium]|nr:hypothetical protein [Kofleriaceae bacterium]
MMKRFAIGFAALVVLAQPRLATAKSSPQGAILFARDNALWLVPADGSTEPARAVALSRPATDLVAITASAAGDVVLLDFGDQHAVAHIKPGTIVKPQPIDCAGPAVLAVDGNCILCPAGDDHHGKVWLYLLGQSQRRILKWLGPNPVAFIGQRPPAVAVTGSRGLWRVDIQPFHRQLVAPHKPKSHLLIAPNGKRAVGQYEINGRTELVGFSLDGEAARRNLITGGVPVVWSADSRWLLVQHEKRACVVRAVGGEYKCWQRYRAIALAPDGAFALVGRRANDSDDGPMRLYVGELAGARPAKPHVLVDDAAGPAVWLPITATVPASPSGDGPGPSRPPATGS